MNALDRISVVFWKEVSDNLRDRRSLISGMMSALIGPVLLLLIIIIVGKSIFQEQRDRALRLPVLGAERAPALMAFLKQNGVEVVPGPIDPQAEVQAGNLDVVLVIPPVFSGDFRAGKPAAVRMVIDSSRQSAIASIERISLLLQAYEQQIGNLRLLARGISPQVINALAIERVDVATPQSQVVLFLNMMPYFIILVVFLGGMYVIIDATAGERERGSLEPLLINPLPRWEFVVGKLAAALPFAVFTVLLTLAAFAAAFNLFPIEDYLGMQLTINLRAIGGIFLLSLPMILLASALQMIIASFTRSYKEAQTYTAFLPLIPALPGIGLAFLPVKARLWMMLVPTFGQQLIINQLMRGEPVDLLQVSVSCMATVVAAFLLILLAIHLYSRERILFGAK